MGLFLLSTSINDLDNGGECALAKSADWEVSSDKVICLTGLQNKQDPAKNHIARGCSINKIHLGRYWGLVRVRSPW